MKYLELLAQYEIDKVIEIIKQNGIDNEDDIAEYRNEREQRDNQVGNRTDRIVQGNTVEVNKIPIPFQKQIVKTAASFMFGNPVRIVAQEDVSDITNFWRKLRLDAMLLKCCEQAKAFRQSAVLFRTYESERDGTKIKVNNLDPRKGKMFPFFNEFDDLDAFLWETKVLDENNEEVTKYYLWDATNVKIMYEGSEGIVEESNLAHGFDRMPIVYLEEEDVAYEDVKPLIDRYENRYSRFADVNDYFSSPFFKAVGKIDNVPTKDDTGSVYMMDVIETPQGQLITSDIDVISWDSAPQSTQLELEIGKSLIYDLSHTPNLSFDNTKGIGNLSGIALKLMFLNTIINQKFGTSVYLPFVERVWSLTIASMLITGDGNESFYDIDFEVNFTSILPEHTQEIIEMLGNAAFNKPVMSQRTALMNNPLVKDVDEEMAQISNESEPIGETLNIQ